MIARGEDHAFARLSPTAKKLRALELQAGMPARRSRKGRAAGYSPKDLRAREKQLAEHAERAYRQLVADRQATGPATKKVGATPSFSIDRCSKAPQMTTTGWTQTRLPAAVRRCADTSAAAARARGAA